MIDLKAGIYPLFRFEKGPLMIIQICDVKKSMSGYLYM